MFGRCCSGDDTTVANVLNLLETAQGNKLEIQAYADKVSSVFVPMIVVLACVVFSIWLSLAVTGTLPPSYNAASTSSFLFAF